MPNIDTLRSMYFVQPGDANPPTEPVPETFENCKITPVIDGLDYNIEIQKALNMVGTGPDEASNAKHFILIANWWLGLSQGRYTLPTVTSSFLNIVSDVKGGPVEAKPYNLDGPEGSNKLIDILIDKAKKGVDVRILGWVSFAVMDSAIAQKSGGQSIANLNAHTMKSVKELRNEPKIGAKAMLNVIAHTSGAVHMKMVVVGHDTEAVGFTGGIDFQEIRFAHQQHPGFETWHDVVAKVEGPAVQGLYDLFQDMWHENTGRAPRKFRFEGETMPSRLNVTPVLGARALPDTPKGKHHVQSLRTVPPFNYKWYNCLPENKKISFAKQGLFEYRTALKKAISNAQAYIYMEDQAFSSQEILSWVRDAIANNSALRVILLAAPGADPVDGAGNPAVLSNSINHGLLRDLSPTQIDQVRMFAPRGDGSFLTNGTSPITVTGIEDMGSLIRVTTDIKADVIIPQNQVFDPRVISQFYFLKGTNKFTLVGNPEIQPGEFVLFDVRFPSPGLTDAIGAQLVRQTKIFVHSKTTLIDDQWAYIGSGNNMRRSLYSDLEHGVSVLDEDEIMVKEYRIRLWAEHFRHSNIDDFDSIQASLHAWEDTWGTAGAAPSRPPLLLDRITLPITPDVKLEGKDKEKYDKYEDLDARQPWGGLTP